SISYHRTDHLPSLLRDIGLVPLALGLSFVFVSKGPAAHGELASFPTRRSSDLMTRYEVWALLPLFPWYYWLRTRDRVGPAVMARSEEHTSELPSLTHLVCRLLLEKKSPSPRRSIQTRSRSARLPHARSSSNPSP